MAKTAEQVIQDKLDALRKSANVEVLKNQIRNYGQEALKWKRVQDAARYKEAKAKQDAAQAKLDEYNNKSSVLIKQLQAAQKLTKNAKTLKEVEKERDFYIEAGEEVPADVQQKYQDLIDKEKSIKEEAKPKPKPKIGAEAEALEGEIPTPSKEAFGPGIATPKPTKKIPTKKTSTDKTPVDTKDNVKELWISYLRSTFAGLEDKVQKAEIDRILNQAVSTKMDEKTFMSLLEGTVWWQTTLPSIRQFFLDTHDKRNASTFAEKLKNKISNITSKLEDLGIQIQKIDPATGRLIDNSDLLRGVAMETIKNNWTDDQLDNYLATKSNVIFTGGGTLGSYYDKIAQQAYLYGVTLDDTMKANINTSLLDPTDGRDAQYWLTSVKDMAYDAPENKAFLPALKAGRNLYEVTNSYRQQMSQLLEVDPTAITWNDLMGKVVDGTTGNARTFADFNKQLKQDPLWQYTKNAKETYSNMALDLAKMFGFTG